MIKYLIAICFSLVVIPLMYVMFQQRLANKMPMLNSLSSDSDRESKVLSKIEMWILIVITSVLTFFAVLRLMMQVEDAVNLIRILSVIMPVICAGCIDYREKRIPNIFPLVLLILGAVFLVVDFIFYRDVFESYLVSCGVAFIGPFVLLSVVGLITGKGIGAGDIKLVSTLGLVCGIYALCGTLIFATCSCALIAAFLLITKKKSLKSSLPYGPFIAIGYLISLIIKFY